jgi:hypothetical protein
MNWRRLTHRELNLDLRGPDVDNTTSTMHNDTSTGYTEKEAARFIMSVLWYMLDEGRLAANFFCDREDMCLRMFCYPPTGERSGLNLPFFEYIPSVSAMAPPVLRFLRKRAGLGPKHKEGQLRIRFKGRRITAVCKSSSPDEIRIFFTDDRPTMHNKQGPII